MRVVVMGAGAIGSLFGGLLASRHEVVLVGRDPHMAAVTERGLVLRGNTELEVRPKATTTVANLEPPDLLLVTVKAHATASALEQAGPLIGEHTFVASLQNGLGNVERIAELAGPERTVGCTTSHGALVVEPGVVEHTGLGETRLGPIAPPDLPAHHELAGTFTACGMPTEVVADIQAELWSKVAVNAAINPLTAITGLPNGALLAIDPLHRLLADVATEVETVARAAGYDVDEGSWVERARSVAERTGKNRSSMLQDVERGRPTEIDAICGAVADRADELGVDARRNRALHALVKGIEATLHYDA